MSNFSCVLHPDIAKFAIIRTDYVAIVEDHAAAMMLSILEGWTNWLREHGRSLWVDLSGNEFAASVAGLFSRKKFMAAGKLLEELGLVARKQKSTCDRTYQYLLQVGTVQERLNLLTFWNAAAKYIQLIFSSSSSSWLKLNVQFLKSLTKAIVPDRTIQESSSTNCKGAIDAILKDIDSKFLTPTTNTAVVEKEVEEDEPKRQPRVVNVVRDTPVRCRMNNRLLRPLKITKITKPSTTPITTDSSTPTPTVQEVREIEIQLRELPLSGGFALNKNIRAEIKKNFHRAQSAIAQMKEAIRTWKVRPNYNWQGQFITFLRSSDSPETQELNCKVASVYPSPSAEQLRQLKTLGCKLDHIATSDEAGSFVQVLYAIRPMQAPIPWWQAIELLSTTRPNPSSA